MVDPTAMTNMFGVPLNSNQMATLSQNLGVSPGSAALPTDPIHSHEYIEQSGKHKGVAGVARDVLGFLGDFLLTRLHMKPMYSESQDDRKFKAAYQGFDQDPAAAVDRVIDVNPTAGLKLKDQWIDNERLKAQQESTAELRAGRLADINDKIINRNRGILGAYLNTLAGADPKDRPAIYQNYRSKVVPLYGRNDPDLNTLLPEQYDPNMIDAFVNQTVPTGTQRRLAIQQGTLDQTKTRDANNYDLGNKRIDTTLRGQDLNHQDRQASIGATIRGQDIRSSDTERGQDLNHQDRQTAETGKNTRAQNRLNSRPKPSGDDITFLRAHPEMRDRFDGRFGVGMAKRILGE